MSERDCSAIRRVIGRRFDLPLPTHHRETPKRANPNATSITRTRDNAPSINEAHGSSCNQCYPTHARAHADVNLHSGVPIHGGLSDHRGEPDASYGTWACACSAGVRNMCKTTATIVTSNRKRGNRRESTERTAFPCPNLPGSMLWSRSIPVRIVGRVVGMLRRQQYCCCCRILHLASA